MFGIQDFGVFLATAFVVNLTPGQDTFYILGRTLSQGRTAGVASVLGISAGVLVHTFAAAGGLSAVLTASANAFVAVKLLGAAYLVYLGVRMLFAKKSGTTLQCQSTQESFGAIFRQGLLTNVLNPKVALFFLALMPQFIVAESAQKFWAFTLLGLCFVLTSTAWCFGLVLFASVFNKKFATARAQDLLNRAAGTLFILLGVRLATSK